MIATLEKPDDEVRHAGDGAARAPRSSRKLHSGREDRRPQRLRAAHHGDHRPGGHRSLLRQGVQRVDARRRRCRGFGPGHAPRKLIETPLPQGGGGEGERRPLRTASRKSTTSRTFGHQRAGLGPGRGHPARRGAAELRVRLRGSSGVRSAKWKGLKIEKPVREFTAEDIERLAAAGAGQSRTARAVRRAGRGGRLHLHEPSLRAPGPELASAAEEVIRIRPTLSFRDGKIEGFDKLMAGVRGGETRRAKRRSARTRPTRPCKASA